MATWWPVSGVRCNDGLSNRIVYRNERRRAVRRDRGETVIALLRRLRLPLSWRSTPGRAFTTLVAGVDYGYAPPK